MSLVKILDADLNYVSKLETYPNQMEDMTPEMLKATFDRAANEIQEYLNNGIVPKINYLNEERKKHQGTLQAHSDRLTEIVDEIESEIADIVNKLDCIIKDDGAAADSTWSSQKIRSSLNELLQQISDLNQGIADAAENIRYLDEENEGRISDILELQRELENAQETIDSVDGMYDGVMRHIIGLHTSVDALEEAAEKAVIDDNALSEESTWSSQKIADEIENAGSSVEGAVLYTPQTLTPEQQAQARENIGASGMFAFCEYNIPTVYFTGDLTGISKDDKVTLNYSYGERSGTCTLKWQGSSSLSYPKKNYTVVFDNAFEAKDGWGEQSKYCLKADWIDFSHCRNVVSAKLWGEIVKSRSGVSSTLSALPNGGAIDGFPCFVVINGEWQGIYNFNIPKDGWMMGMGSGEKEAILCAGNHTKATSFNAEAVLGTDFDLEYHSDSFTESEIQASLNTLINACRNSDGTDIDTTIAQYVDLNSVIDYMIFTAVCRGIDIVTKNYILATNDGVKWYFSAYDLDSTWGLFYDGSKFDFSGSQESLYNAFSFYGTAARHTLFYLLYRYKKAEIIKRYNELRTKVLTESNVDSLFLNYAKNIPSTASVAENELWKAIPSTGANTVDQITKWYADRAKWVDEEVKDMSAHYTKGLMYTSPSGKTYVYKIGTAIDTKITIPKFYVRETADGPIYITVYGIYGDAFKNTAITDVVISEGVQEIKNSAFHGCSSLESVEIPRTVTTFGAGPFASCTALKELVIPGPTSAIPDWFAGSCRGLTNIELPSTVVSIGGYAFTGCSALTSVILPNELQTLGTQAFNGTGLGSVYVPDKVHTIGTQAFRNCTALAKVRFEGTPASIASDVFTGCSALTDIYVPWAEGAVAGAPWGATDATIHYNSTT